MPARWSGACWWCSTTTNAILRRRLERLRISATAEVRAHVRTRPSATRAVLKRLPGCGSWPSARRARQGHGYAEHAVRGIRVSTNIGADRGHDLDALLPTRETSKKSRGPVSLHISRGKGRLQLTKTIRVAVPRTGSSIGPRASKIAGAKPPYSQVLRTGWRDCGHRQRMIASPRDARSSGMEIREIISDRYSDVMVWHRRAECESRLRPALHAKGLRPVVANLFDLLQRGRRPAHPRRRDPESP